MYEPLLDLSAVWDGCGDIHPPSSAVAGHIVITLNGNCTITQKAQTIEVGVHTVAIDICNMELIFKNYIIHTYTTTRNLEEKA